MEYQQLQAAVAEAAKALTAATDSNTSKTHA